MGYISAAIGIGKALFGIGGARNQEKADKQQVQLAYEDNLEKIRRREFAQEQTLGTAVAFGENSGVLRTGGSTAQATLDVMAGEFKKELDWMKQYAKRAKGLGVKSARVNRQANIMGAISGGAQTGLNVYGALS